MRASLGGGSQAVSWLAARGVGRGRRAVPDRPSCVSSASGSEGYLNTNKRKKQSGFSRGSFSGHFCNRATLQTAHEGRACVPPSRSAAESPTSTCRAGGVWGRVWGSPQDGHGVGSGFIYLLLSDADTFSGQGSRPAHACGPPPGRDISENFRSLHIAMLCIIKSYCCLE